ncbi:putative Leucine-rich repeat receptor-like protein kinase family protein [Hibiscus syriacus]|uniref:S-protein homolog n=1 Tax=Hibiscus syriacus TaxID=106335 RepID=A0A6A3A152_HIBSY|nr:putative Leucine-rich repeat receptor-like protein kinase family protein [Hibiscus syriacus]
MLLAFCASVIAEREDAWFINYHIYVTNHVPDDFPPGTPSLSVHCKSGDKDIGEQWLLPHEDYTFDTKIINLTRTTLFFCNIWWEGKEVDFVVFKATRDENRCRQSHNSCLWSVRDDGFYFSSDGTNWNKEYPW